MLDHQTFTLLIALGTFVLTGVLYVVHPEGILPASGYRRHPGDLRGAAVGVLRARWRERQQQLATIILKDPDVDSLSSFIGVDGTNTTLNSGRILINLKTA